MKAVKKLLSKPRFLRYNMKLIGKLNKLKVNNLVLKYEKIILLLKYYSH